jgi:hypothetical protein
LLLEVRQGYIGHFFVAAVVDLLEKLLHCQEDDARVLGRARDCVRFAASRSAVGENRRIVSVKNTIQQGFRRPLVHVHLRGIVVEDSVEGEDLVFDLLACARHD